MPETVKKRAVSSGKTIGFSRFLLRCLCVISDSTKKFKKIEKKMKKPIDFSGWIGYNNPCQLRVLK